MLSRLALICFLSLSLIVLMLTGCATTEEPPDRGSLSDAMNKAKLDNPEERRIQDKHEGNDPHHRDEPPPEEREGMNRDDDKSLQASTHSKVKGDFAGGVVVTGGTLFSNNTAGVWGAGLSLEGYLNNRQESSLQLSAILGGAKIAADTESGELGCDTSNLDLDFRFTRYTNRRYTGVEMYVFVGGGLKWMFWDFEHPLYIMSEDDPDEVEEVIDGDTIVGMDFNTGIGFSWLRTKKARFSCELVGGGTFWSPETEKGFDNDYFDTQYYLNVRVPLMYIMD